MRFFKRYRSALFDDHTRTSHIAQGHLSRHTRGPLKGTVRYGVPTPLPLTLVKTFEQLYAELTDKAATRPPGSGTVVQLDAGVHAIGKKIVEEAAEVWMAAEYESTDAAAEEISQLLYHLQVLMLAKGLTLEDVYRHL